MFLTDSQRITWYGGYDIHVETARTKQVGRCDRFTTSFASVLECFMLSLYRFLRFYSSETEPDSITDMAQHFTEGGDFL